MSAKPRSELPTEPWRSFLADLDALLDQPTDLHCIGGFAISQYFGFAWETADLDVLSVVPQPTRSTIAAAAGKDSALHRKHRVSIDRHIRDRRNIVNQKFRSMLTACLLCTTFLPLIAKNQSQGLHLVLDKPHQLRDLVVALQMKNWLITFEEGPVLSTRELETKTTPTGVSVQVPRTVPVTFDLSAEELAVTSSAARGGILRGLLASYINAGYTDSYRVVEDGRYLHIVPSRALNEDGNPQGVESVLGATVSFPEQRFETLYALVEEVLSQVSQQRGVSVVIGNVPTNLFRQTSVVEVANNEAAREVLARAFAETNGPRLASGLEPIGLAWTLSYDPTDRQYWFSVNSLHIDIPGVNGPKDALMKDTKEQGQTSPTRPNSVRKIQ